MPDYTFNMNDPYSRVVDEMMEDVFGLKEAKQEPVWENEPDHMEWHFSGMSYMYKPHKKKRFRKKYAQKYALERRRITLLCEIKRHPQMLHLCGYVSVPQQHPLWGKNAFNMDIDVHGGLTYGRKVNKSFKFGFDCGHFQDYVPGMHQLFEKHGLPSAGGFDTYRNFEYVTREVLGLAEQLLIKESNNNE